MIGLSVGRVESVPDKKKTYHEIILEMAQELVGSGQKVFRAADLYNMAKDRYPYIKRHVFNNRVMAAAPKHTSYKHLLGTKDYFEFLGNGMYKLK